MSETGRDAPVSAARHETATSRQGRPRAPDALTSRTVERLSQGHARPGGRDRPRVGCAGYPVTAPISRRTSPNHKCSNSTTSWAQSATPNQGDITPARRNAPRCRLKRAASSSRGGFARDGARAFGARREPAAEVVELLAEPSHPAWRRRRPVAQPASWPRLRGPGRSRIVSTGTPGDRRRRPLPPLSPRRRDRRRTWKWRPIARRPLDQSSGSAEADGGFRSTGELPSRTSPRARCATARWSVGTSVVPYVRMR